MRKKTKKVLVLSLGIILILVGLLGLALPFLQGFLFMAIGFILVSFYFPQVRPWLNKHLKRFPHLLAIVDKVENWMAKFIGEI